MVYWSLSRSYYTYHTQTLAITFHVVLCVHVCMQWNSVTTFTCGTGWASKKHRYGVSKWNGFRKSIFKKGRIDKNLWRLSQSGLRLSSEFKVQLNFELVFRRRRINANTLKYSPLNAQSMDYVHDSRCGPAKYAANSNLWQLNCQFLWPFWQNQRVASLENVINNVSYKPEIKLLEWGQTDRLL